MEPYLNTLRLVPDEVILAAATHAINVHSISTCLAGAIAVEGVRAYDLPEGWEGDGWSASWARDHNGMPMGPDDVCRGVLGGTKEEWHTLYIDAAFPGRGPEVEEAFVARLDEAAARTRLPRRRKVTA